MPFHIKGGEIKKYAATAVLSPWNCDAYICWLLEILKVCEFWDTEECLGENLMARDLWRHSFREFT